MAPTTILVDAVLYAASAVAAVSLKSSTDLYSERTLLDSTPGLHNAWGTFCEDYHLGDAATVVHETHGRRLYDTLKEYCKIDDETKLQAEIDRFEEEVINGGPVVLPGVLSLLEQLSSAKETGWTIVTSATRNYAPRAIARCGIPMPDVGIVTSSDVEHGKPHPAPYLAGAAVCGIEPTKCMVVEDAISGIKSGKAAGAVVLGVCTSTPREIIEASDVAPDYIVSDLSKVTARCVDGRIEVTIHD